ncbi:hypothetical protein Ddc_15118 [Ditylenchus destructor]|nr:hypothetical protein Ddc_15118 [Ditylenchus destructor]
MTGNWLNGLHLREFRLDFTIQFVILGSDHMVVPGARDLNECDKNDNSFHRSRNKRERRAFGEVWWSAMFSSAIAEEIELCHRLKSRFSTLDDSELTEHNSAGTET